MKTIDVEGEFENLLGLTSRDGVVDLDCWFNFIKQAVFTKHGVTIETATLQDVSIKMDA